MNTQRETERETHSEVQRGAQREGEILFGVKVRIGVADTSYIFMWNKNIIVC